MKKNQNSVKIQQLSQQDSFNMNQIQPNSLNTGHWSNQEKLKYLIFLDFHLNKFCCKRKRFWKIYKALSRFIESRTAEQCRCHHRKLLHRFSNPLRILSNMKKQYEKSYYQSYFDHYSKKYLQKLKVESIKFKNEDQSYENEGIHCQQQALIIPPQNQNYFGIKVDANNIQPLPNISKNLFQIYTNYQLSFFSGNQNIDPYYLGWLYSLIDLHI